MNVETQLRQFLHENAGFVWLGAGAIVIIVGLMIIAAAAPVRPTPSTVAYPSVDDLTSEDRRAYYAMVSLPCLQVIQQAKTDTIVADALGAVTIVAWNTIAKRKALESDTENIGTICASHRTITILEAVRLAAMH